MSKMAKGSILGVALVLMAGVGIAWTARQTHDDKGVAVVELFTSEGCSSCPPADELLARMVREARPRVFPLAFHVDYWDSDPWRDAFSSPAHSDRQQAYAKASGARGVYTPQMIVNGGEGFVGSDAEVAAKQIAAALKQSPTTSIDLQLTVTGNQIVAQCTLDPSAIGKTLNVALAERQIQRKVLRGENAGRVLRHENVVRAFQSIQVVGASSKLTLMLPSDSIPANCSVVVYVQDRSMRVTGAVAADLQGKAAGH
ncbi:MAG TPA: DUF1223 domain-containing protein [Tepidisphaeraceae bacterium]|jgi:hypothetical protein